MTLLRLFTTTLLAVGLLSAQSETTAQLDSVARAYAKERGFMGSILVARGGDVLLEEGYGMANLEWDVPNTRDTKFRLGSITKQFTATLVLKLHEQGKIGLEDPISKYVPDLPEAWRPVTIHQLLNHTSGIVSYTGLPEFRSPKMRRVPLTPLEIVLLSKENKLDFQPGEGFKYNNTGYVLLGHLIEKVSGEKYDAFLKAQIFDPLSMKNSGYDWTRPLLKRRASGYGYNRGNKTYQNADFLDMSLPHAAGSLYSTVGDLLIWHRALSTGKLLKKESFDRMFTPGKNDYGYGWIIQTRDGQKRIGHGGGINGFSTMIQRYPDQDAVVIALGNVENGDTGPLAERLGTALFGGKVEYPWDRKEVTLDSAILERYVGTYQLPPFKIKVTSEDGKLMLHPDGQRKHAAMATAETKFFVREVEADIEFAVGEDGKASELILRQGGGELRGKRVVGP
jgi:CubicO group peptidase (beta-lactamase class C family)